MAKVLLLALVAETCIISGNLDRFAADESFGAGGDVDTIVFSSAVCDAEAFGPFDSTVFTEDFFALRNFNSTPAQGLNIIIQ